mmetsp:Transcript_5018/g.10418  ORF Transcript_5018/g.10418 Transcript_5018/m.10418 type:complete len:997 (-) Transcript_5018:2436-5426(-)
MNAQNRRQWRPELEEKASWSVEDIPLAPPAPPSTAVREVFGHFEDVEESVRLRASAGDKLRLLRKTKRRSRSTSHENANSAGLHAERILVAARIRPSLPGEEARHVNGRKAVLADPWQNTVSAWLPPSSKYSQTPEKAKRKVFDFDHVFDAASTQADVFDKVGKPLVENVLQGINGCLLAYGQTGAGKTFTTFGPLHLKQQGDQAQAGLLPRIAHELFAELNTRVEVARNAAKVSRQQQQQQQHGGGQLQQVRYSYALYVTYYQIYLDSYIQDLLNPSQCQLQIRLLEPENNSKASSSPACHQVEGLSVHRVTSVTDILQLLTRGDRSKVVSQTSMNAKSSRSHSIFTLQLVQHSSGMGTDTPPQTTRAKLTCVDLAGSERVNRTHPQGLQLEEAKSINRSLSALGNVIAALGTPGTLTETQSYSDTGSRGAEESSFIPWRDSKLTRVLQESLSGRARVSLVINVGPGAENVKESINSLLFGRRSMSVSLEPQINAKVDYKQLAEDLQSAMDNMAAAYQARLAEMEDALLERNGFPRDDQDDAENNENLISMLRAELNSREQEIKALRESQDLLEEALFEQLEINTKLEAEMGQEVSLAPSKETKVQASTLDVDIHLRARVEVLQEQLHEASLQAARDQQRAEDLQVQAATLSQAKEELESELAQARDLLESTQAYKVLDLKTSLEDLREKFKGMCSQKNADDDDNAEIPPTHARLKSPRNRRRNRRSRAKSIDSKGTLEDTGTEMKQISLPAERNISETYQEVLQQLEEMKAEKVDLESKCTVYQDRIVELESSIERAKEETKSTEERFAAELEKQTNILSERALCAETELTNLRMESQTQSGSIEALEKELEIARAEFVATSKMPDTELSTELENVRSHAHGLEEELCKAKEAYRSQEERVNVMKERLDSAEAKFEAMLTLHSEERGIYESMLRELSNKDSTRPHFTALAPLEDVEENDMLASPDSLLSSPRLQSALKRSKMALARAMEAINDV